MQSYFRTAGKELLDELPANFATDVEHPLHLPILSTHKEIEAFAESDLRICYISSGRFALGALKQRGLYQNEKLLANCLLYYDRVIYGGSPESLIQFLPRPEETQGLFSLLRSQGALSCVDAGQQPDTYILAADTISSLARERLGSGSQAGRQTKASLALCKRIARGMGKQARTEFSSVVAWREASMMKGDSDEIEKDIGELHEAIQAFFGSRSEPPSREDLMAFLRSDKKRYRSFMDETVMRSYSEYMEGMLSLFTRVLTDTVLGFGIQERYGATYEASPAEYVFCETSIGHASPKGESRKLAEVVSVALPTGRPEWKTLFDLRREKVFGEFRSEFHKGMENGSAADVIAPPALVDDLFDIIGRTVQSPGETLVKAFISNGFAVFPVIGNV